MCFDKGRYARRSLTAIMIFRCRTTAFCLFLVCAGVALPSDDTRAAGTGQVMAEAMRNMMEAMGLFMGEVGPGALQALPEMAEQWANETAPGLEGLWISNSGERLLIHDSRFILDAGRGRQAQGILQIRDNYLALHSPRHNHTWFYEFAEHQGRLALRDSHGRLYLFRRSAVAVPPRADGPMRPDDAGVKPRADEDG